MLYIAFIFKACVRFKYLCATNMKSFFTGGSGRYFKNNSLDFGVNESIDLLYL
jgi:hypothetical protein